MFSYIVYHSTFKMMIWGRFGSNRTTDRIMFFIGFSLCIVPRRLHPWTSSLCNCYLRWKWRSAKQNSKQSIYFVENFFILLSIIFFIGKHVILVKICSCKRPIFLSPSIICCLFHSFKCFNFAFWYSYITNVHQFRSHIWLL